MASCDIIKGYPKVVDYIVDRKLSECYSKDSQVWILHISAQTPGRDRIWADSLRSWLSYSNKEPRKY